MSDPIADAIARVNMADREALASRVAFASGRFEEYWKAKADEATARIEALYEQLVPNGEDSGEGSGGSSGISGGSEGGGPTGPSGDAPGLPPEAEGQPQDDGTGGGDG